MMLFCRDHTRCKKTSSLTNQEPGTYKRKDQTERYLVREEFKPRQEGRGMHLERVNRDQRGIKTVTQVLLYQEYLSSVLSEHIHCMHIGEQVLPEEEQHRSNAENPSENRE